MLIDQLESLQEEIAYLEKVNGPGGPFVKALRQQEAKMKLERKMAARGAHLKPEPTAVQGAVGR